MTQGGPFSSLLFSTVLQAALKDDLTRWRERGMGIRLGDSEADCLSNLRFADDVLPTFQEKHRECGAENPPGQDQNSQQSGVKQKKRGVHRQHQSRSITSERMFQVSRTNNNVRTTRNNGNQESIPSSLGIIYQVRTGANIEIVLPTTQTSLIQYGHHSHADIRLWNMDTLTRT